MSTKTFLEVEAKLAVAESIQLPELTRLSGVNHIAETRNTHFPPSTTTLRICA